MVVLGRAERLRECVLGSRIQFILEQVLLRNFMGPREHQVSPDILEYKFFETHQVKHLSPIHKFYLTSGSLDTYKALGFVVDIKFKTKFPPTHTYVTLVVLQSTERKPGQRNMEQK